MFHVLGMDVRVQGAQICFVQQTIMGLYDCCSVLQSEKYRGKVVIGTVYLAFFVNCVLFTIVGGLGRKSSNDERKSKV